MRSSIWKVLGVAGLNGEAATGVAVARKERQRRAYSPQQIRDRLHARHDALVEAESEEATKAWRERRR